MNTALRDRARQIRAVFFDIDDTLRRFDDGYIPDSVPFLFKVLKDKGIFVGIASGRAYYGVVPEIRALEPDCYITVNGSFIVNADGQTIYEKPISADAVAAFVNWAKAADIDYGMVSARKAVVSGRTPVVDQAITPVYGELEVAPDFHQTQAIYQMWTFETVGDRLALPDDLTESLRMVRWHEHSSDVFDKDSSKATGVAALVEKLDLQPENILVFGDGLNDIELFEYAGLAVAMGGAHDEVKKRADFITKNLEEDGILYALEELGMIDRQLHFPQTDIENAAGPKAAIKTSHGVLTVKLFPEQAPKAVANFIALAKDGYYDGVIFHRIIKDFMIQGGDPTGTGRGGESVYGESFEDEFSEELYNIRGALSMANAGPNTNGSQFFIVQNQSLGYSAKELVRGGWPQEIAAFYATEGGTPHLDRRHTVFGQLADAASYEVLDKIAEVETDIADKPLEPVIIETIEVIE